MTNGRQSMNKRQRARERKRKDALRKAAENSDSVVSGRASRTESHADHNSSKERDPNKKPTTPRPHFLTITLTTITLLLSCAALYWNIAQPDIRYVASLSPETMTVVESKVDSAGNFVHSLRVRATFTNYSLKPGFIDKAEWVPLSIATLPDIKITSIDRSNIFWRQKKQIEITFLMTVPTDPIQHLNTTRELAMEQVLAVYDNTGRKVERLENGLFGRIRFNFADTVKTELNSVQ
jgi:hypothetical protein